MAHIATLIRERRNNYIYNHQFTHPNLIILKAKSNIQLLSSIQSSS